MRDSDLCLIVTDAVSFNVLYRGQLEYLVAQNLRLTLICGGAAAEIDALRARNVGQVIAINFRRNPHPVFDVIALTQLIWHFLWHRYPTVVYTTPKALLLGAIAAWATRQNRRVAFFQGRVYENYTGLRRRVFRLFDQITIFCSQSALFVSHSLMTDCQKEIPTIARKGVVLGAGSANGVDITVFDPAACPPHSLTNLRETLGFATTDFIVVIVGRITGDKGIREVAQVIEKVTAHADHIRFLFIGSVETESAQIQLDQLTVLPNVSHVNFTPAIAPYMALADIHLFLSHREGFGNVAIEAAAMGTPTIAFDVVGIRDSVAQDISGWRFIFGDTTAVAQKILTLSTWSGNIAPGDARSWVLENYANDVVWAAYAAYLTGPQDRHRERIIP